MDFSSLLRKKPSSTPTTTSASTCIIQILALGELAKKREKEVDIKRTFKDEWVAQFPRAKLVVDLMGKIHMVRYKTCSLVEGTNKIANFKLDETCKNMQAKGKSSFLVLQFWLVITISTMIANIKKMKRYMLPKVQILLQI